MVVQVMKVGKRLILRGFNCFKTIITVLKLFLVYDKLFSFKIRMRRCCRLIFVVVVVVVAILFQWHMTTASVDC